MSTALADVVSRRGCVSTRPNPIGLSVAEIISVGKGCLVVGGADIVDGSPVLDVKPYVAFCDSCPGATAPGWVQVRGAIVDTRTGSTSCSHLRDVHPCQQCFFVVALEQGGGAMMRGMPSCHRDCLRRVPTHLKAPLI